VTGGMGKKRFLLRSSRIPHNGDYAPDEQTHTRSFLCRQTGKFVGGFLYPNTEADVTLALMRAVERYSDIGGIDYWCLLTLADSFVVEPEVGTVELRELALARTLRLDRATVCVALNKLIGGGELRQDGNYYRITAWERAQEDMPRTVAKYHKPLASYVYLFRDRDNLYKIGHSVDPQQRAKDISQPNFPIDVICTIKTDVICTIKTDDASALEHDLHEHFVEKRVKGEWFSLTQDDIDTIISIYPSDPE